MTYEQAVAKQRARGPMEVEIRRGALRPGGWATRDAQKMNASRERYEHSERGREVRLYSVPLSTRRSLLKGIRSLYALCAKYGIETNYVPPAIAAPMSRKDARALMRTKREAWWSALASYEQHQQQRESA